MIDNGRSPEDANIDQTLGLSDIFQKEISFVDHPQNHVGSDGVADDTGRCLPPAVGGFQAHGSKAIEDESLDRNEEEKE